MLTIQFLRMLADLSFYGSFAAFVAAPFGGTGALGGVLLCCAVFALTSCFPKRGLRFLCLLPLLLVSFYRGADRLFLLPCVFYALWLSWQGDYEPDAERQRQLFSVFWKIQAFFLPFAILNGLAAARTALLPYVLLQLAASVLLMRTLRHEPSVRCRWSYQAMEFSLLALTLLAARFFSSAALLRTVGAAFGWAYSRFVLPVLEGLLRLLMWVLQLLFRLLSLRPGRETAAAENSPLDVGAVPTFDGVGQWAGASWLSLLLRLLLLGAAVVLLVFFFRWMSRRRSRVKTVAETYESRETFFASAMPRRRENGSVKSIRRQYRRFLKLCRTLGAEREKSSTSLDVEKEAKRFSQLRDLAGPIRALYVPARYGQRADKDAEEAMRRLCAEARDRASC